MLIRPANDSKEDPIGLKPRRDEMDDPSADQLRLALDPRQVIERGSSGRCCAWIHDVVPVHRLSSQAIARITFQITLLTPEPSKWSRVSLILPALLVSSRRQGLIWKK
jgi:hypothetical protein